MRLLKRDAERACGVAGLLLIPFLLLHSRKRGLKPHMQRKRDWLSKKLFPTRNRELLTAGVALFQADAGAPALLILYAGQRSGPCLPFPQCGTHDGRGARRSPLADRTPLARL